MVLLKMILYPLLFIAVSQPQLLTFIRRQASRIGIRLPLQGREVIIALIVLGVLLIETQVGGTRVVVVNEGFDDPEATSLKLARLSKTAPKNTNEDILELMKNIADIYKSDGNQEEKEIGDSLLNLRDHLKNNPSYVDDIRELINQDSKAFGLVTTNIVNKYAVEKELVPEEAAKAEAALVLFFRTVISSKKVELPEERKSNNKN